jgi:pimeloyl-ACP methyl ester carboxylesterase
MAIPASETTDPYASGPAGCVDEKVDAHLGLDSYRRTALPDGRKIEYIVEGDPEGFPLVFHHGTPGAAVAYPGVSAAARERGLALVFCSRPGYGESSPHPGRTVVDVASDVACVLDDLGRNEFVTLGWSGGGPHALACAARLPQRCRAAATGAGVAPFHSDDLDFFDGMGTENVLEYAAALIGPNDLRPLLEREAATLIAATPDELATGLGGLLSPVDRAYVDGDFAARLHASITRGLTRGVGGWIEDDLAFTRPWGFNLDEITVPVCVWHGGEDRTVPIAHGTWLASQVPGARSHLYADEGHLSLWRKLDAIFDELVDRAAL